MGEHGSRLAGRGSGEPRRLTILGATGSIGKSTLDVVRRGGDAYRLVAVTANRNAEELAAVARDGKVEVAAVGDASQYRVLKEALSGSGIIAAAGPDGLIEAAARSADWTMAAISGAAGLAPTWEAIRQGKTIAIANKECLVAAGQAFMQHAAACRATVLPVDSEHSAAFQALDASGPESIEKIVLTASGGPFRQHSREALAVATPAEALKHPNWSMGAKVTIDSATLMNKGLELIEAMHLFAVRPEQLDVVVHPQSIIHSLVYYRDGSVLAQMGTPDMRTPIAYSLSWPLRVDTPVARLDLVAVGRLTFEAPDPRRFPALELARRAMATGGTACTVLNAANEVAVEAFLAGRLSFPGIAELVERTLGEFAHERLSGAPADVAGALAIDGEARDLAYGLLSRMR